MRLWNFAVKFEKSTVEPKLPTSVSVKRSLWVGRKLLRWLALLSAIVSLAGLKAAL